MHTRPKKGKDTQKQHPHFTNSPTNLWSQIKTMKQDPKCTLTHSKTMYIKESKIAWSVNSGSSKALRFLSFHKIQNKHKGVTHTQNQDQGLTYSIISEWWSEFMQKNLALFCIICWLINFSFSKIDIVVQT